MLLTHCCWRSAPYDMFLMLLCQMSGCYLCTAFCLVLLTLCSLCLYVKCVDVVCALLLVHCSLCYVPYVCRLYLYFKCVVATYALLLAQCSLRYAPYAGMLNAWVLEFSLRYVLYAYILHQWVLLTHCVWRSAPYVMLHMLLC